MKPLILIHSDDALPTGDLYQQREEADLIDRQRQAVEVDLSQTGTDKAAAGAAAMPTTEKPKPPDPETIANITAGISDVNVRGAVDAVSRGLFGISIDQWQQALETGTLPQHVSTITNVGGNAAEMAAKEASAKAGLDPETTAKVVGITGMLGAMVMPPGGGKKLPIKLAPAAGKVAKEIQREGKAIEAGLGAVLEGANINVGRVNAADEVKATIRAISALQAEKMSGARKTVTNAQTIQEGKALGMTLEQATTLDVEKYDVRVVQQALRDYHNAAGTHLTDLMNKAAAGDEEAAVAINYAFATAGDLSVRDEMLGKLSARALQARQIKSVADRAPFSPEAIKDLAERMAGGVPVDRAELIERGKTLATRLQVLSKREREEFARHAVSEAQRGRSNVLYEAWMNWGLLSGPQTHVANMTSNALTTLWAPGERTLAAMASAGEAAVTLGRNPREVFMGEGPAMLYGMVHAFKEAAVAAGASLRTGTGAFGPDKVERGADAARRVMMQADDTLGHGIGFFATAFRFPTRALTAEDSFFKVMNYRMELYAQAYREASQQGLSGSAFAAKIRDVVRNADDYPQIKSRAEQFALVQTFNKELQGIGRVGDFAGGITTAMEAVPGGRLVMPFVRTPANIMHFASERTPFLNAFSDTLRADIIRGGAARSEAFGKVAGGAMLGAVVMDYAASGLIVGGGPSDPAERAMWEAQDGRKPYSVRIGDQWVGYGRLDPLGLMMGTVADAMEIMSRLPDGSPIRAEVAAALTLAFAKNMVSKTYLQGVADLFSAFSGDKGLVQNLMAVPKGLARSVTPSLVRTVERTEYDPERSETRVPRQVYDEATGKFVNDPFAEVQMMLNEIKAGIPGLSSTLPPVRNRYGESVLVPPGFAIDIPGFDVPGGQHVTNMLSPMFSSAVKEDHVSRELSRLHLGFSKPQPVVFGKIPPGLQMTGGRESDYGVELNPREADRLYVLAGQGGMAGSVDGQAFGKLPTFRESLDRVMRTPGYQTLGDRGKRIVLSAIDNDYKKAASAQILKESPGLQDLIDAKLRDRANDIKPGAGDRRGGVIGPGLVLPGAR